MKEEVVKKAYERRKRERERVQWTGMILKESKPEGIGEREDTDEDGPPGRGVGGSATPTLYKKPFSAGDVFSLFSSNGASRAIITRVSSAQLTSWEAAQRTMPCWDEGYA